MDKVVEKYFLVSPPEESEVALVLENWDIDFVNELNQLNEKVVFKLENGQYCDVLANELGWPMFSQNLKALIGSIPSESVKVKWHEVKVLAYNQVLTYFVPETTLEVDVLDNQKTIFGPNNFVVRPCISGNKAKGLNFFPIPNSDTRYVCSEYLIALAADTGVNINHFEEVYVSQILEH